MRPLLKRIACQAAAAASLMNPLTAWEGSVPSINQVQRIAAFQRAIRYSGTAGTAPTAGKGDARQFLALAYGVWPLPGIAYDPDVVRDIPLQISTSFDAVHDRNEGATLGGVPHFQETLPDLFAAGFSSEAESVLVRPRIENHFVPPRLPSDFLGEISVEGHEAMHAEGQNRHALLQLLQGDSLFRVDPASDRGMGFGPDVEAAFHAVDSEKKIEDRHRRVLAPRPDGDLKEYPLLYTEVRSFLTQVLAAGLSHGTWTRPPLTEKELWAAFDNAVGGLPNDSHEPIRQFLDSPEGRTLRAQFPVPGATLGDGSDIGHARDRLREAVGLLPASQRAVFYRQLPQVFGEILEDSGDVRGKARFGLQPSPLYALAVANHLIYMDEGHDWTTEKWRKMAARVEDREFAREVELAVAYRRPEGLQALLDTAEKGAPFMPGHVLDPQEKADLLRGAWQVAAFSRTPAQEARARQDIQILTGSTAGLALQAER